MKCTVTPREAFQNISIAMNAAVIRQETVIERLLIAFLADGHVLMEGLPGVAKTRAIKTLGSLSKVIFAECSLRQTCCRLMCHVQKFIMNTMAALNFSRGRYSAIRYWLTK